MYISDFFSNEKIINADVQIKVTHYADSPHPLTVTFAENLYYLNQALENPNVEVVITSESLIGFLETEKTLVISEEPKKSFFEIHNHMFKNGLFNLIESSSISKKSEISKTAIIKDHVIIEDGVVIEDYAVIESNTHIKKNVYVGPHAVVGARGMHNTFINGECLWVKDAGGVIIESGVQVLAHATIQKSYFYEPTVIGKASIVSVHCNIGHGCKIGQNTMIAGHAQLAGYTSVGNDVWVGPAVTTAHGITVGDKAEVLVGSVVINDIAAATKVSGNFAMSHRKNLRKFTKESK